MLSKLLFICYPFSQCYIFWLLEALLYNPQRNTYVMRGCVYSLYPSHNILRTMGWWRIWCRKHLTHMCEWTNSQIFLVGIPEWKRPLKEPKTDGGLDLVAVKLWGSYVLQSVLSCGYEHLTICKQQRICFSFMLMCSSLETLSVRTVKWGKEWPHLASLCCCWVPSRVNRILLLLLCVSYRAPVLWLVMSVTVSMAKALVVVTYHELFPD